MTATECVVTMLALSVVSVPYDVVRPYSTCVSLAPFVVYPMVAPDDVIADPVMLEITGAVVSLLTVTLTAVEVFVLPAASRATAVNVWAPLVAVVVSHVIVYGVAVSSAPRFAPSSMNWTPATPTLSEAVALTVMVAETVAPAAGLVTDTAGAVPSRVVNVASADIARLPLASFDRTR